LEAECAQATNIPEKVEFIVSLAKMEASRRNTMMGRYRGDGFLVQKAIEFVKKVSSQANSREPSSSGTREVTELVD
jgi:hypothetical protein